MTIVAGCTSAPAVVQDQGHAPVIAGEEFTLAVGDSARIGDSELVLMFDGVSEDSRCPRNVTCVWEGNARVRLKLREYSHMDARAVEVLDENVELNTSSRFVQRWKLPVGWLVLRGLGPQVPIDDPKNYVATLCIEAAR
jgi:hypothetical protein